MRIMGMGMELGRRIEGRIGEGRVYEKGREVKMCIKIRYSVYIYL